MAENRRSTTTAAERAPDEPLLRKGRPADPAPEAPPSTQLTAGQSPAEKASDDAEPDKQVSEPVVGDDKPETTPGIEKTLAESRQRKLRLMLRQCDRVMLMDFEILAMSDWPDNYTVAVARRHRDFWLFCLFLSGIVFLSGMTGFVPAWLAGGGFGVFVILLLSGLPAVRALYTRKPSFLDLIIQRRRLLQDARKHVQHLEGTDGLVWQCARMAEFNSSLKALRFSELLALSERKVLARHLKRREHVRLYLIYLLEAEKAYARAEQAFFEGHQEAIDNGWESVAATSSGQA